MWSINTFWFEVSAVSAIYAIGNILFGHFEELTPKWRRVSKYIFTVIVVVAFSYFLGRTVAMLFLGFALGMVVYVHGFVLPKKGINGWTAEPKDKYYEFRGWNKKKKKKQ